MQNVKKICKTTTDNIETFISTHVMQSKNYTTEIRHKLEIKKMKGLTRYHFSLTNINRLKNQLQKCIDIVFFQKLNSLSKFKYSRSYMIFLKILIIPIRLIIRM